MFLFLNVTCFIGGFSARVAFVASILLLGAGNTIADSGSVSVDDILKAWKQRPTEISSFVYECEIKDIAAVFKSPLKAEPFSSKPKGSSASSVLVNKHLVIKRRGTDISVRSFGGQCDSDNYDVYQQTVHSATLGTTIKRLSRSSRGTLILGMFGKRDDDLLRFTSNVYAVPVMCWYDPSYVFQGFALDLYSMRIVNDNVTMPKDVSYIELVAKRYGAKAETTILCNTEPPFLPIAFERFSSAGWLLIKYEFSYVRAKGGEENLSHWSYQKFNKGGELIRSREGSVTNFTRDASLDDSEFDIVFPVGAHLIEHTSADRSNWKYWIQDTDDRMQEIKRGQYGRRVD